VLHVPSIRPQDREQRCGGPVPHRLPSTVRRPRLKPSKGIFIFIEQPTTPRHRSGWRTSPSNGRNSRWSMWEPTFRIASSKAQRTRFSATDSSRFGRTGSPVGPHEHLARPSASGLGTRSSRSYILVLYPSTSACGYIKQRPW
jgi:hypothetical protein